MEYVIITDTAANLTNELITRHSLSLASLVYIMEDTEYLSIEHNTESDLKDVFDKMRSKVRVTTSCISPTVCKETFEKPLLEGKDILYIGFSSGLSNSFNVAKNVLEELKIAYPDRKILYVDTLAASMGQGRIVTLACEQKEQGKSIDEVHSYVEQIKLKMCHLFTVDNLTYLYKGGRVNKTSYLIASTLNIKPIMHVNNEGKLVPIGKMFGRKLSLNNMASRMSQSIVNPEQQTIYISHGDCIDDVEYLIQKIKEKINVKEIVTNYIDLVIGAHSGPGTVAVFFLGENR